MAPASLVVLNIIIITTFIKVIIINNIIVIIGRTIFKSIIEFLLLYNFYIIILIDTLLYKNADRNNIIKTDIIPKV